MYFLPDITWEESHFKRTDLCVRQTTSDFCELKSKTLEWIQ